jgi:hypothetical protein
METNTTRTGESQRRLRAIVELIDGELKIYPIGQSDTECNEILSVLLLDGGQGPRQ